MSMINELVEELIDNADLYTKELHDLMYRAADTIEMLSEKAREPNKWIPCSERLPSEDEDVMAWVESGDEARIACCNYAKGAWLDAIMDVKVSPVAWMPLPDPYKGNER